jgi:hypothetical protein
MSDDDKDLLFTGAIVVGVVLVGKSLLNTLGVSGEDKQAVDDQGAVVPDENPFSYQFQPFIDLWSPRYGNATMQEYWQGMKQWYDGQSGNPQLTGDHTDIAVYAESIYKSIGFWQTIDENTITFVFNEIQGQVDVAAIDAYLSINKNVDLLSFLRSGQRYILILHWGLTDTILAGIIAHVNALPVVGALS